ncbi:MAG: hypothetical protein ILP17_01285, partial [Lachnospiraceae bacterium]|nr:hypothetical protein [Lachnospiraceae bacterium]
MRQNESPDNNIPVNGGMQDAGQTVQYAAEPQPSGFSPEAVDAAGVQMPANAQAVDTVGVQADVNAQAVDAAGMQADINAQDVDATGVQADVNAQAVDAAGVQADINVQAADGAETDAREITDVQAVGAGATAQGAEQDEKAGDEPEYMIDAEGLVKIYKTKETEVLALSGLDLKIQKGEFTALIGNSG